MPRIRSLLCCLLVLVTVACSDPVTPDATTDTPASEPSATADTQPPEPGPANQDPSSDLEDTEQFLLLAEQLFGTQYNEEQQQLLWERDWQNQELALRCQIRELQRQSLVCELVSAHQVASGVEFLSLNSTLEAQFETPLADEEYLQLHSGLNCRMRGMLETRPQIANPDVFHSRGQGLSVQLTRASRPEDCLTD